MVSKMGELYGTAVKAVLVPAVVVVVVAASVVVAVVVVVIDGLFSALLLLILPSLYSLSSSRQIGKA